MDLKDDMPTAQEMIDAGIDPDLMSEITAQMVKGNLTRNQVIAIFRGMAMGQARPSLRLEVALEVVCRGG